ncbi:MAG: NfeD family protein [Gammaproteobacteria bacterium]
MKPLIRYTLLQIPGWVFLACLLWWANSNDWISFTTASWIMAAWLLKDALLYPLCKPAFDDGPDIGPETLLGRETETIVALNPEGMIRLDGEHWTVRAKDKQTIPSGQRVRVTAIEGLVLIVEIAGED